MTISLGNRAKMSTSTTGTGTITLGSAVSGFQTFADAGITNGQTVRYAIDDGANFEIGSGTYTSSGTTLTRSVTESSNSDSAISLSGSAEVFIAATVADLNPLYAANPSSATSPTASGTNAVAAGDNAVASGEDAVSIGDNSVASGLRSISLGGFTDATANYAAAIGAGAQAIGEKSLALYGEARHERTTAIGQGSNTNVAIAGIVGTQSGGAVAIGNAFAGGVDSLAAAITNNTNSYGATGANSVAIGYLNKATHNKSVSLGDSNSAVGAGAITLGSSNFNSGVYSTTIGYGHQLYGKTYSLAIGRISMPRSSYSFTHGIWGTAGNAGEAQAAQYVMSALTTDATPDELAIGAAGNTDNYIVLANSAAVTFTGTVVAREDASDGDDYAGWELKGVIMRAANAGTTALGVGIVNSLYHTAGLANADVALTADTSNGGLKITVTGVASTNLNWVATINTSEVVNT